MLLLKMENVLEKSFLNSSENAPRSAQSVVSSPDGLNDEGAPTSAGQVVEKTLSNLLFRHFPVLNVLLALSH